MARIRTIKPEFPQSESMGSVSRDARLLFIQLWTICDDEGRARGNSRMLASLLFPYDDDAPGLIDGWMAELEREACVVRYTHDGATYIEILNWLNHQKIDKPSKSKIPAFDGSSRILANPRERSSEDQGSKDQGSEDQRTKGEDQGSSSPPVAKPTQQPKTKIIPAAIAPGPKSETELQASCRAVWSAYSAAYGQRYSVEPVRNVKVNSNVKSFVQRIGAEEAPSVAAFFLSHNDAFYVRKGHDFGLLLNDAEKIRMEWASQRTVTATQAAQADRTQANREAANQALEILEAGAA